MCRRCLLSQHLPSLGGLWTNRSAAQRPPSDAESQPIRRGPQSLPAIDGLSPRKKGKTPFARGCARLSVARWFLVRLPMGVAFFSCFVEDRLTTGAGETAYIVWVTTISDNIVHWCRQHGDEGLRCAAVDFRYRQNSLQWIQCYSAWWVFRWY